MAMFTAAGIDIAVKALTGGFDTPQIVLLRSLFALPIVLLICHYQSGLKSLARPRWGWQIYRGFLTAGANFGFLLRAGACAHRHCAHVELHRPGADRALVSSIAG